ncbi:MAG: ABC transporter ATP-binding protein [Pseudomonadota bacterium]
MTAQTPHSEVLLSVEHLSRHFGPIQAVQDISFTLNRGEVLGFLGPNGAGKSTTMKMLTGNLSPSRGSITINGHDILDEPKQAKMLLGYLPEQPPVYRELTVDEYLSYCARLNRIRPPQRAQALANAKARCGLDEVGRRLIGNLSKGFQQRVGIAQAIIHAPDLVILDEPTVGLDPIQIREIRELIRDLGKEHSVILSTHILPEVLSTCNRVQIINKGRLVYNDTIAGLNQRMQTSSLLVQFTRGPNKNALSAIPGVTTVETLEPQRFRLHYLPEQNPAERLVELSVQQNWGLCELTPERRTLEEIFVDLTCSEPAAPHVEQEVA